MSIKTYGSLFAGVGGIDIGLDNAGLECKFQVEIDKNCQETLQYHWPNAKKYYDIQEVNGHNLQPVDLITFGSPCQDLSIAGKRAGLDGERSGLFYEAMRIVKEMRCSTNGQYPKWTIWENVTGALSSNDGADFGQVLHEMDEAGACFSEWAVLDAQYFGVPQRRRRVFVISCYDPSIASRSPQQILPLSESSSGGLEKSRKKKQEDSTEVAACLKGGGVGGVPSSRGENLIVEKKLNRMLAMDSYVEDTVASTIKARDHKSATDLIVEDSVNNDIYIVDTAQFSDVRVYENNIVPTLTKKIGTGGNNVPLVSSEHHSPIFFSHTQGLDPQASVYHSPTLRREGGGAAVYQQLNDNDVAVRRLTPIECERLMGWPDNHTLYRADGKENSDTNRYKMCGNGVASPVIEWIAKKIINI